MLICFASICNMDIIFRRNLLIQKQAYELRCKLCSFPKIFVCNCISRSSVRRLSDTLLPPALLEMHNNCFLLYCCHLWKHRNGTVFDWNCQASAALTPNCGAAASGLKTCIYQIGVISSPHVVLQTLCGCKTLGQLEPNP